MLLQPPMGTSWRVRAMAVRSQFVLVHNRRILVCVCVLVVAVIGRLFKKKGWTTADNWKKRRKKHCALTGPAADRALKYTRYLMLSAIGYLVAPYLRCNRVIMSHNRLHINLTFLFLHSTLEKNSKSKKSKSPLAFTFAAFACTAYADDAEESAETTTEATTTTTTTIGDCVCESSWIHDEFKCNR